MDPQLLTGKILVIGPSRAGKSYLATAWKAMGLPAVDADADTNLLGWYNDATGERLPGKPASATKDWFRTNHFLAQPAELQAFLAGHTSIILLAHCWNIMELIGQFDAAYLLHVSPPELARRMTIARPDHPKPSSPAEIEFMTARHVERQTQARRLGIPFLDATRSPQVVLRQMGVS